MKWPVYILLIAVLAYVGETIRVPFQLALQIQQQKTECCHQSKEQECPYMHPGRSARDKDTKNNCCNPTANCTNCPLCYTAELAAIYTTKNISSDITQHYPEIPGQPLADYTPSAWKPPNV